MTEQDRLVDTMITLRRVAATDKLIAETELLVAEVHWLRDAFEGLAEEFGGTLEASAKAHDASCNGCGKPECAACDLAHGVRELAKDIRHYAEADCPAEAACVD